MLAIKRFGVLASCFLLSVWVLSISAQAAPLEVVKAKDGAEMVLVPEGTFIMGSDKVDKKGLTQEFGSIKPWYMDEHPKHKVKLKSFYIDRYEVTNAQYREFVRRTGKQPPKHWVENGYIITFKKHKLKQVPLERLRTLASDTFRLDIDTRKMTKQQLLKAFDEYFASMDDLPVYNVSWFDASDYCEAVGLHLPTEEEWEVAARGTRGQEFPWGNKFLPGRSNTGDEEWEFGVAPVGSYEADKSPYGVYDMAGNVSEWVEDWYQSYPHSDFNSDAFGKRFKVFRGAGWGGSGHYALKLYQRAAHRLFLTPDAEHEDLGFRCAQEADRLLRGASLD